MGSFRKLLNENRVANQTGSIIRSTDALVKTGFLDGCPNFPLIIEPLRNDLDPVSWMQKERESIKSMLTEYGAILLRGFGINNAEIFSKVINKFTPNLLDYMERAASRDEITKKVFTSTKFAADQVIPLHHEMSYSDNWPTYVFFYCALPPDEGGQTPLANERWTGKMIDPEIKKLLRNQGIMYVRNYRECLDSWQSAFQCESRSEVESYCNRHRIEFEWCSDDHLRTRQIRQAITYHPVTGEEIWFNHLHLFHESNLDQVTRASLLAEYGRDGLPRNSYCGDGTVLEDEVVNYIRQAYNNEAIKFDWQQGDVLLLDNFLMTHGRAPYSGKRQILVAMSDLYINKLFNPQPIQIQTIERFYK